MNCRRLFTSAFLSLFAALLLMAAGMAGAAENGGAVPGLKSLLSQDWQAAATELQAACDQQKENRNDYNRLLLWLARARSSPNEMSASQDLLAYLDTRWDAAPGDWFSLIAGHLIGTVAEKDVFAAAADPDAEKQRARYCEAWYYAGMRKLLGGDKATAAGHLRKCLATKKTDFVEYQLAEAELRVLGEMAGRTGAEPTSTAAKGGAADAGKMAEPGANATPVDVAREALRPGRAKLEQNDSAGAIAEFTRLIEAQPSLAGEAYFWRSVAKDYQGDLEGALADIEASLRAKPGYVEALVAKADLLLNSHRPAEAVDVCDEVLAAYPDDAFVYALRARAHARLTDFADAIEDIEKALKIRPGDVSFIYIRGSIQKALGNAEDAIKDFTAALEGHPGSVEYREARAETYAAIEDFANARADYEKVLAEDPDNTKLLLALARACTCLQDWDKAGALYSAYGGRAKEDLDYPQLYLWVALARNGDDDVAHLMLEDFMKEHQMKGWPTHLAMYLLGKLSEKDLMNAARHEDEVRERGQLCEAWYFIGVNKMLRHDQAAAVSAFRKAMATNSFDYFEYTFTELRALGELPR